MTEINNLFSVWDVVYAIINNNYKIVKWKIKSIMIDYVNDWKEDIDIEYDVEYEIIQWVLNKEKIKIKLDEALIFNTFEEAKLKAEEIDKINNDLKGAIPSFSTYMNSLTWTFTSNTLR